MVVELPRDPIYFKQRRFARIGSAFVPICC